MSENKDTQADRIRRAAQAERPRRFYKEAAVSEGPEGFAVLLDGRGVRTPAKSPLVLPDKVLGEAVAAEWRAQGEFIDAGSMPLTRLVNTIVDGVARAREEVAGEIARYGEADMLCYRAEGPAGLVARQTELWDPVLVWAEEELGIAMLLAEGVKHVQQREETLKKLRQEIEKEDDFPLGAAAAIANLTGSALLTLALLRGRLSPDEAWEAAHVDEDWQISQWGEDAEATARRERRRGEFDAAALIVQRLA